MHLPVTRLRGCEHDVRTPRRAELLRPCSHGGPAGRRVKRLDRGRSLVHRPATAALALFEVDLPRRPRARMTVRRRPSQPPHCTHVPPPGRVARIVGRLSGFCVVCLVTYGILIGAMATAALTHP